MAFLENIFKTKETKQMEQIFSAVESGDMEKVKDLVTAGQSVNVTKTAIKWPLILSAIPYTEVLEFLIQQGANVNSRENSKGYTPLINAVLSDQTDAVKILLENYADIHLSSAAGLTALHYAIERLNDDIVKLLLDCEKDPVYLREFIKFCENTSFDLSIYNKLIEKRIKKLETILRR